MRPSKPLQLIGFDTDLGHVALDPAEIVEIVPWRPHLSKGYSLLVMRSKREHIVKGAPYAIQLAVNNARKTTEG